MRSMILLLALVEYHAKAPEEQQQGTVCKLVAIQQVSGDISCLESYQ